MAYNRFKKLEQLEQQFQVEAVSVSWLSEKVNNSATKNIIPSEFCKMALKLAQEEVLNTEKSISECLISPILREIKLQNPEKLTLFSGVELNVDKSQGLNGFCDFILVKNPRALIVKNPIFCVVEAKKGILDEGLAQCGAELIASQILAKNHENKAPQEVYGIVTNGLQWQFLKLVDTKLMIDPNIITISFDDCKSVLQVMQGLL